MIEAPLYEEQPVMFQAHPIAYLVCLVMIPVFGLGLFALVLWWLDCLGQQ